MKKIMKRLCMLLMLISVFWFLGTSESQVLAAEEVPFTEPLLNGVEITNDMIAPEPTTQGKENYIFAGYYADEKCETPVTATTDQTVYAKFVPSETLSVKAQLRDGTTEGSLSTNLRLVSSVDSLNYSSVGFEVYYNNATKPVIAKTSTVYERIVASAESGVDYNYSPKVVGTESEYFVTATLVNINKNNFDKGFYIKPYWKTLDGTTVYGEGKYLTVNNGMDSNNINVPVKVSAALNESSLSVTVAGTEYPATVAKYDGTYAYLNITVNNRDSVLKSLSAISVTDETTSGTAEYRNLMTKYTGTADTSWYESASADTDKYVIATSADLYGLSYLVKTGVNSVRENFEDKEIYVVADITVNEGNAEDWATTAPTYSWEPIGGRDSNGVYNFKGTFDAQMHTISGLYHPSSSLQRRGMFGSITSAHIRNLKLTNSYFVSAQQMVGSIIGYAEGGSLNQVYSDAIVHDTSKTVGGLVGYAAGNIEIANCWYDGRVSSSRSAGENAVGGLVGQVASSGVTCSILDCLNTGTVTASPTSGTLVRAGGLLGYVTGTVNLENCLNVGMVSYPTGYTNYGSVVGQVSGTLTAAGVYALKECCSGKLGVTNDNIVVTNKANMMGADAVSKLDQFNFTNWSTVPANVAVPKAFENVVYDTSWYDEDKNEYVLYDKADLLGFAELSQTNNFAGKVIKLGADIVVNKGTASEWASEMPAYNWIAIGNKTTRFAGAFDGDLHTIQGLYLKTTSQYTGLFGITGDGAIIQNLKLKNSYFESSGMDLGSIVGACTGTNLIDTVSSDAIVSGSNVRIGGLIGGGHGNTSVQYCCYEGTVTNTSTTNRYTGGILGCLYDGCSAVITNCLNTGVVDVSTYTNNSTSILAGGIVGGTKNNTTNIRIANCLMIGKVLVNEEAMPKHFSLLTGYYSGSKTLNNNYAVIPTEWTEEIQNAAYGTKPTEVSESDITGDLAIDNLTNFNFTNVWATVTDDTPVLRFLGTDDETKDTRWYNASATEYVLYNKDDLYGFAELSQTNNFAGKTIKLGADIVVNGGSADNWTSTAPEHEWTPVGNSTYKFAGTFDGCMHSISGLYLSKESRYAGLFASIGDEAVVKNLKLKNSYLTSTGMDLGSIAGACSTTSLIDTVYSDAIVSGSNARIGGLVGGGFGTPTIQYCWFDGTVTNTSADNRYTGGIMGCLYDNATGVIENCLNTGTVDVTAYGTASGSVYAGGFVGGTKTGTNLTITKCLMNGTVLVNEDALPKHYSLLNGYFATTTNTISNNYAVIPSKWTDAIKTGAYSKKPTEVTAADIIGDNAKATLTSFDFYNVWSVRENDTPILIMKSESRDEYIVHDVAELMEIAVMSQTTNFAEKTIKLTNNIDLTGYTWTPIGGDDSTKRFAGTFDGQGNTISGISVKATSNYTGLFAATATSAQIENLILKDSQFVSTVDYVGTVVGYALGGTFSNIRVENIEISGRGRLGGLIGSNGNAATTDTITMNNCSFDGTITSPGTEKDYRYIGGLIGYVTGNMSLRMSNCMNSGTISANNNESSENPGVGGLVGCLMNIKSYEINSCLNVGEVIVKDTVTIEGEEVKVVGYGPIIGRITTTSTPLEIAESVNNYTVSSCLNADTVSGIISADADAIKENAEAALPELDFETHWLAEAGNFPQVRFATTGYVAVESIEVTADMLTNLTELYPASRELKQGDIHGHADNGGASDGTKTIAEWAEQMKDSELDIDFAASLDHRETEHINIWKDHAENKHKFIYGSEIPTTIDKNTSNAMGLHYNVIFAKQADFVNVLQSETSTGEPLNPTIKDKFDYTTEDVTDDDYAQTVNGVKKYGHFKTPSFTRAQFEDLIKEVKLNNGFFVIAHPMMSPSYITAENAMDAYFADEVGIEVMNTVMTGSNAETGYKIWKTLLKNDKRVWATTGSDTHDELKTNVLTSIYAEQNSDEASLGEAYVRYLREGNFTAGSVGLQMSVGSTQMGGTGSFKDAYLEIGIGALHKSVYDATHKYRVDVWAEDGIIYSQPLNATTDESQMTYLRTKADPNCKYYRVEVYDVTTNTRIAIGNPIWNSAKYTTVE